MNTPRLMITVTLCLLSAVRVHATCPASYRTPFDLDGDGRTDGNSTWRLHDGIWKGSGGYRQWGNPNPPYGDIPVPADYDGDGKTDLAIWRPGPGAGTFSIIPSSTGQPVGVALPGYTWMEDDVAVAGDFNGDGYADFAIWRPHFLVNGQRVGQWLIVNGSAAVTPGAQRTVALTSVFGSSYAYASSEDIPVAADYDGDGQTDVAVWRPITGIWYVVRSHDLPSAWQMQFGGSANRDYPVVGDYDGDCKADPAVWRSGAGMWYSVNSSTGYTQGVAQQLGGSANGDLPVPGDYDGDGKTDVAVWRPNAGSAQATLLAIHSTDGNLYSTAEGSYGDIPLAAMAIRASNPITGENGFPGTPNWDIDRATRLATCPGHASLKFSSPDGRRCFIEGFSTDISVQPGETIGFKIYSELPFRAEVYRLGYYDGDGGRLIATLDPGTPGQLFPPNGQTACAHPTSTVLNQNPSPTYTDCSNWTTNLSWLVPAGPSQDPHLPDPRERSGIHLLKVTSTDGTNTYANHIWFVVRDPSNGAQMLVQTSDTTWQAYNMYTDSGDPSGTYWPGAFNSERARKASYNRPFDFRDWFLWSSPFNAEIPMAHWLERNGYDVGYTTGLDVHRYGVTGSPKVFVSVGHDEYWSQTQRNNVEAARAAGVNLAFLSGDTLDAIIYFENGNRTMVAYKDSYSPSPPGCPAVYTDPNASPNASPPGDPRTYWTGLWRDYCWPYYNNKPQNRLTGTSVKGDILSAPSHGVVFGVAERAFWFWRNTPVSRLGPTEAYTSETAILEYEWDGDVDEDVTQVAGRPPGLVRLASSVGDLGELSGYTPNYLASGQPGQGQYTMTLYRDAGGALVFSGAGTQWAWMLDNSSHDYPVCAPSDPYCPLLQRTDINFQQATINIFADMGVQPVKLQPLLGPAVASTDHTPPTSAIGSPASGATVSRDTTVTVSGTAVDSGTAAEWRDGVVASVELSFDGTTWHPATLGPSGWTYTWQTPGSAGDVTIRCRAVDDSGNLQGTPATIVVHVQAQPNPPTNVIATTQSETSIQVSWNPSPSSNVTGYYVYSSKDGGDFQLVTQDPVQSPWLHDSLQPTIAYRYKVLAWDGSAMSADSNIDLATTVVFDDVTLTAGVTPVRAIHVIQLRQAIDAVRHAAGWPAATYTDPSLCQTLTAQRQCIDGIRIKHQHVQELRDRLGDVLSLLNLPMPNYTDSPLTSGTGIKKNHIDELRAAVQ